MDKIDIRRFFETQLPLAIESHAEEARKIDARYQLSITGPTGGDWLLDLSAKTGPSCKATKVTDADCTIAILDDDFHKLCENPQANAMQLFFAGKLKVTGNQMLAMKLGQILSFANLK